MKNFWIYTIAVLLAMSIYAIIYSAFDNDSIEDINSYILIGTKFSDLQPDLSETYTTSKSAGGRITYSFDGRGNSHADIAVKNDTIEVMEVYNVFSDNMKSLNMFEGLVISLTVDEKCKLTRAYNSTFEFTKNGILIRVEQIPTKYGWIVKFTAYKQ